MKFALKRYVRPVICFPLLLLAGKGWGAEPARQLNFETPVAQIPVKSFAVENVRVFDGERFKEGMTVEVRGGKIAQVGQGISLPKDTATVDGTGRTLLPGFIDAHTHTWGPPYLRQALAFGVTTELDMFSVITVSKDIEEAQARGEMTDIADLRTAGILVTAPKGHGTEYGFKIPTITKPEEAQQFVDDRIAEGSDYIKIVYGDGSAFGLHFNRISRETLAAIVSAAHQRGKLAVVHIGSLSEARDVIEAGADGLEHLFVDRSPGPDFGRFVAAHHVFITPTLSVLQTGTEEKEGPAIATDPKLKPYLKTADIQNLNRKFPLRPDVRISYHIAEETIRSLLAAKVPILAGTDAPNPGTVHGASIHGELELLQNAGLTSEQALAAATSVPASLFKLSDRGRIAVSLRADLVLVSGNPQTDIKATRNIIAVWKAGIPFDRIAYKNEVQASIDKAKTPYAVPANLGDGLISDFESGMPRSNFGCGWIVSTDAIIGGKSTAKLSISGNGANGSGYSLLITGTIDDSLPYAWAGAMFSPGEKPFQPVDLASMRGISFWTKGDGKTYRVLLYSKDHGRIPLVRLFSTKPDWKQCSFSFGDFGLAEARDIQAIIFSGGPEPAGDFSFQIDNVRLDKH